MSLPDHPPPDIVVFFCPELLHPSQVPVNMSASLRPHPEQSSRNLENRRRKREVTLLRKAHELHVDHNAEVYIVVQHRENDRVLIFNSEPAENWPIPYEKLVSLSARLPICRLTCAEKLVPKAADQHAQEARPAVEEGPVSAARRCGRGQSRHRRARPQRVLSGCICPDAVFSPAIIACIFCTCPDRSGSDHTGVVFCPVVASRHIRLLVFLSPAHLVFFGLVSCIIPPCHWDILSTRC